MKTTFLVIVFCVAFATGQAKVLPDDDNARLLLEAGTQDALEDLLIAIINSFRTVVQNGLPCLGIPPLDPLVVPAFPLNMSTPLFRAQGEIANVTAAGLGAYEATRVSANIILLNIELEFVIQNFLVAGNYDIDGLAWIFPIYGRGPFSIRVADITAGGRGRLVVAPFTGKLSLSNLNFTLQLGAMDIRFEGLLGGGDLGDVINEIANALGLTVFETVEALLHDTLTTAFQDFANNILKDLTLKDIIDGLIGFTLPPDGGCGQTTVAYKPANHQ